MINKKTLRSTTALLAFCIILVFSSVSFVWAAPAQATSSNLAKGKPYTSSDPASMSYPDTNENELTDGQYASPLGSYHNSNYHGRLIWGSYDQTIDLGDVYSIEEVFTNFFGGGIDGIDFPASVTFSSSVDGINFDVLGVGTPQALLGNTKKYMLTLPNSIQSQFVKMTVDTGNHWIFTDEMEVWGTSDSPDPVLPPALLSDIKVDGQTIAEFDPNTLSYSVILPPSTSNIPPAVTVATDEQNATVIVTPALGLDGIVAERTTTVSITADDRSESIYTITFTSELGPTWTLPKVDGFFIQPSLGYGSTDGWSSFTTQLEFDEWAQNMADVGAEMLFYQWTARYEKDQEWYSTVHGGSPNADFAYYDIVAHTIDGVPTNNWVKSGMGWLGDEVSPVQRALDASEKAGIKLWLGLYLNEDPDTRSWWNTMSDNVISLEDQYIIDYHVARSISMVDDLYAQFGNHPAFGGFYYSIEIANITFYPEENWPILANLISEVADAVHNNDPNVKIALCPFFNTNIEIDGTALASPVEYGAMWEYVLAHADLDVLILQDGVGVEPLTLTESVDKITPFFRQVAYAARLNNVEFWGSTELFTNISTDPEPRLNPIFVPGDITKIKKQLQTVAKYVDKIVSFEFHYMDPAANHTFFTPIGGSPAADAAARLTLYNDYKHYYKYLGTASP